MSDEPQPIYAGAALGFRVWKVNHLGLLSSVGAGQVTWRRGVNLAYCEHHDEPHEQCACGLYACHSPQLALSRTQLYAEQLPLVVGAVAARGQLQIHHHGFRAEEAQITALALAPKSSRATKAHTQLAAERYGVPLVSLSELGSSGERYAQPVPEEMRPALAPEPKARLRPVSRAQAGQPAARKARVTDPPPARPVVLRGLARGALGGAAALAAVWLCGVPTVLALLALTLLAIGVGGFIVKRLAEDRDWSSGQMLGGFGGATGTTLGIAVTLFACLGAISPGPSYEQQTQYATALAQAEQRHWRQHGRYADPNDLPESRSLRPMAVEGVLDGNCLRLHWATSVWRVCPETITPLNIPSAPSPG